MSLSIGIFGLPNVGKSTLFKALTKKQVGISNYPFCTIEPNVGIVEVFDERLGELAKVQQPQKTTPATIKFIDVAGLVKDAHKGEGLGNKFLANLREANVLLHLVRCFQSENIAHISGKINPIEDIEIIESEIILKDSETIESRLEKTAKSAKGGEKKAIIEFGILNSLKERLARGIMGADFIDTKVEKEIIDELCLLTTKPQIYLLNGQEKDISGELKNYLEKRKVNWLCLSVRDELDKSELSKSELEDLAMGQTKLPELIKKCYQILDLITFFTIKGAEETRAWPIKRNSDILEGAAKIHSDFKDKFIRADVLNWQEVVKTGSWKKCRELGLLKNVGKEYIIKDGDTIEIKI